MRRNSVILLALLVGGCVHGPGLGAVASVGTERSDSTAPTFVRTDARHHRSPLLAADAWCQGWMHSPHGEFIPVIDAMGARLVEARAAFLAEDLVSAQVALNDAARMAMPSPASLVPASPAQVAVVASLRDLARRIGDIEPTTAHLFDTIITRAYRTSIAHAWIPLSADEARALTDRSAADLEAAASLDAAARQSAIARLVALYRAEAVRTPEAADDELEVALQALTTTTGAALPLASVELALARRELTLARNALQAGQPFPVGVALHALATHLTRAEVDLGDVPSDLAPLAERESTEALAGHVPRMTPATLTRIERRLHALSDDEGIHG